MKKIRSFAIISLLLATVMSLASCSNGIRTADSFDEVLNEDYIPESEITEKVVEIPELSGAQFVEAKGEFMTFMRGEADSGISRIVYSTRNKKVVYMASSNSGESVEVTLYAGIPAFTVTKTSLACADQINSAEATCELYDAAGNLAGVSKSGVQKPIAFADTVLFDGSSYNVYQNDGVLIKTADIPENLYIEDCSEWNDKYFYTYGDFINVYTRDFEHVYSWEAPSWADVISRNMLNNGNVLVQYLRPLDNLTEKYDIYEMDADTGEVKKYDIFTVILNPSNKSESEIKLDYKISQITTGQELVRISGDNGMYRNTIDNIAYIFPIKDKQVDTSESSADIVLMTNKGKIERSLKLVENQRAVLPTCIGENVYLLPTSFGTALVDIDGNLLKQISNVNINVSGKNIISDGAIYTLEMDEVYSLSENNATVIATLGETIFVRKSDANGVSILAIRENRITDVISYDILTVALATLYFEELNESGCYAICNVQKGEYLYYSAEHKLIHSSTVHLDKVAADFKFGVSLYSATVENIKTYYAFY